MNSKTRSFHVHYKDIRVDKEARNEVGVLATPLSYMVPCIPGHGDVNWARYISALLEIGYQGAACIEVEDKSFEDNNENIENSLKISRQYLKQFIHFPEKGRQQRKIKVGVIGLGFIGKQHVEALRRLPYVEIVAGSDSNPAMRDWCEENGIGKYYADYKEMLKNEEMDAVHNCTPNNFHFAVSCEILEAGYHVYSEKPLTINSEEGNKLVELARKKGLKTAVNFNYRNNLMVQEMQQRIKNNRMGTISHIQVEYLQDWLLYDTDFDWRVQKDKGGESRAVADIGSHCFDTIQFIMGEKIVAVYAMFHKQYQKRYMAKQADTFSSRKASGEHKGEAVPVENEDAAIILFKLEGGMVGSINITQVCAGKKNVCSSNQ